MIDAVILDLGNVLVFHDNALLVRRLAERAGTVPEVLGHALAGELSNLINRGALDAEGIRGEICRILGADLPMSEFFELWSSHFTIHEAVLPRVEALAARMPLVLLSNTNVLHWEWLRPKLPVLSRFRGHVLSFEVGHIKPEPEIYARAVELAGVPASRAVFFDDIAAYVDAARAVGLQARVFTDSSTFDQQLRELGIL